MLVLVGKGEEWRSTNAVTMPNLESANDHLDLFQKLLKRYFDFEVFEPG